MVPILNRGLGSDRRDSFVDSYDRGAWWRATRDDDGWCDCNAPVRPRRKPRAGHCSLCDGGNCHLVPMARINQREKWKRKPIRRETLMATANINETHAWGGAADISTCQPSIIGRPRGRRHGPRTRLMGPGDLGGVL